MSEEKDRRAEVQEEVTAAAGAGMAAAGAETAAAGAGMAAAGAETAAAEAGMAAAGAEMTADMGKQAAAGEQAAGGARQAGTLSDRYRTAPKEKRTAPAFYPVLGAASAVYALFYTFCLYKNASGITYPFFVAGTLLYFFFCMRRCRVPSGSKGDGEALQESGEQAALSQGSQEGKAVTGFYAVSICLLGISVCLTDNNKILWMTKTGIFLLTVTLALRCVYQTQGWSLGRYIRAMGRSLAEMVHYIDTPFADTALFFREKGAMKKNKNLKYVLLGIVTAVPMLIVILALLLSADAVFYEIFREIIGDLDLSTAVLVCLMAAAVYVFAYSFLRGLLTWRMPAGQEKEKKGEPVAAITFTLLIALIYLMFCVIQVVYLFAGYMQLPAGLTWASYARQGFFQLLFVSLINLVIVLVCLAYFKESRVLKLILTAISLMTYIMIASSAYRMLLYIQNFYLTFLRVFVLWSLAVIAVVFAGVILSVYRRRFPLFHYCTVVVTVFYIVLAFAKPDYWIASYDIARAEKVSMSGIESAGRGGYDDFWYLSYNMSADAAPALLTEEAKEIWDEGSAYEYYVRRMERKTQDMGLRNFNFSRQKAREYINGQY